LRYAAQSVTLGHVPRQLSKELQRLLLDTVVSLGNQARVAEHLGVDQATVSRWISGRQGMDIGQCLRLAKLTHQSAAELLRWANHDPNEYLEAGRLPPLAADASMIDERIRILDWEKKRRALPDHIKPMVDQAIDALLKSYQEACAASKPREQADRAPARPRRGR
jgi:DNA-binding transcriptional regulator YdaS (Cro superfamily)